jgi:hypothetical protein
VNFKTALYFIASEYGLDVLFMSREIYCGIWVYSFSRVIHHEGPSPEGETFVLDNRNKDKLFMKCGDVLMDHSKHSNDSNQFQNTAMPHNKNSNSEIMSDLRNLL